MRIGRPLAALIAVATLLAAGTAAGALVVWLGLYDIAANVPHTQAVHSLMELTMHRSVKRRAAAIEVPPLDNPARVLRGAACFRDHCLQCHGAPGRAQAPIGRSMQPLPGPLVDAPQHWNAAELYWITRNGIRMSGMPAWQYRLDEAELWALVAFMQRLPALTAAEFTALADTAAASCPAPRREGLPEGFRADAARGRIALTQHACTACHRIPGVTGSDVHVGPPLAGLARRQTIAGRRPNTPDEMLRWIIDPRHADAQTTMPALELREADARDIVAYLGTLQ
ncbi:c-type cytochrome [Aquincola sp. S2]|uniref:C-type cytochrome n=1 Tax=Pseudaquabacterium terrae TaxID=2732868 RepID=A0ABX2EHY9_9BURK|nr:c-type cytochrome [Aquabacterium terrae]NRF68228.1 c-type cytochrome [Aquabacterium terrae]